jgi:hypothetical protein
MLSYSIGPAKAQVILGQMLEKLNNPKITNIITGRIYDFKQGCKIIETLERPFATRMLMLWKKDTFEKAKSRADIPKEILHFWYNCLLIEYRGSLDRIKRKCRKKHPFARTTQK